MTMTHQAYGNLDQVHILLAILIAAAYLAIPFTSLRYLARYLPKAALIGATFFFLTCAITHIAIAAGFHDNQWMIVNDLVQAVSAITFIASLSRMVGTVFKKRAARAAAENTTTGETA